MPEWLDTTSAPPSAGMFSMPWTSIRNHFSASGRSAVSRKRSVNSMVEAELVDLVVAGDAAAQERQQLGELAIRRRRRRPRGAASDDRLGDVVGRHRPALGRRRVRPARPARRRGGSLRRARWRTSSRVDVVGACGRPSSTCRRRGESRSAAWSVPARRRPRRGLACFFAARRRSWRTVRSRGARGALRTGRRRRAAARAAAAADRDDLGVSHAAPPGAIERRRPVPRVSETRRALTGPGRSRRRTRRTPPAVV